MTKPKLQIILYLTASICLASFILLKYASEDFFNRPTVAADKKPAVAVQAATRAKNTTPVKIAPEIAFHLQNVMERLNNPLPIDEKAARLEREREIKQALKEAASKDEEDRMYAITVLGGSQQKQAVPVLIKALRDSSNAVRQEALLHINRWQDVSQKEQMQIKALQADDSNLIYTTLESIVETHNKQLLKAIKKLSRSSPDKNIAKLAAESYEILKAN